MTSGPAGQQNIMRVATLRAGICLALFWSSVPESWASIEVGKIIQITNGPGAPGGIFHIENLTEPSSGDFTTFCAQVEESIRLGDKYLVEEIGRQPTASGSRPLGAFTAWLYTNYLDQTLSHFKFSSPSGQHGNELQLAIWASLGYTAEEIGQSWYDASDTHLAAWQAEFAASGWTGLGDIYIMRLLGQDSSGEYTVPAQDLLVRVSNTQVPEPGSLFVWVGLTAGVAGAVAWRIRPGR
jgi:hypothetical protein